MCVYVCVCAHARAENLHIPPMCFPMNMKWKPHLTFPPSNGKALALKQEIVP